VRVLVFIVVASSLLVGVAAASKADWTGSAKCGSCHPQHLASWLKTPHASTASRFTSKPPGKCLACHGTGDAPAGTAIAVEVGCEACHGAGAAYAEDDIMRNVPVARALGLVDVSANRTKTCMTCHARQTKAKFDPLAPVHPVLPKKP
jgi:Cytochrome c554 and c-prime